jgi:hypothetical protein
VASGIASKKVVASRNIPYNFMDVGKNIFLLKDSVLEAIAAESLQPLILTFPYLFILNSYGI